jgi:hypothetical protein
MRILRVGFVIAALALAAGSLAAQTGTRSNRSGQWLGVGIGSGWGRVTCTVCDANRGGSLSGYLRVGGTVNRRFLLGVESDAWMRSVDNVDHFMIGVAAQLYYYPNPRKRLFYKAGLGMMMYQADDGPGRVTSRAFGPNLGAGYDLPISPSVSFTPFASVFVASLGGKIKFNGETFRDDGGLTLIQLGMGVTWH